MPNTANYSFPTPADTDLVKNGADAIRDLGDAVDTAMNTALGTKKSGLVLLNTTSFSAVSSQSVNDVFSATYDNYKILLRLTAASADLSVYFRFRVSGSDNTTGNYNRVAFQVGSDNASGQNNGLTSTYYSLGSMDTTAPTMHSHDMVVSLPFATDYTTITNLSTTRASTGTHYTNMEGLYFNATTSFTGFSLIASTGNFTGKVITYGFNQ